MPPSDKRDFPSARLSTLPDLYKSFVPGTRASSSSGGGSISETMADSDGVSDHFNITRPGKHDDHDRASLRSDIDELQKKLDSMTSRMEEHERSPKQENVNDAVLLEHSSAAVKLRIADAFRDAADEQYRLGDLLAQRARLYGSSPTATVKAGLAQPEEVVTRPVSVQSKLPDGAMADTVSPPPPPCATLPAQGSINVRTWMPRAVQELKPLDLDINIAELEKFTWEEVTMNLCGQQWSPGLYFAANPNIDKAIRCRTFWLLEHEYEPFAPSAPGMHGAKMTVFFRSATGKEPEPADEDYNDLPVFVSMKDQDEYTYMGHYTQFRFSDKLGYDSLEHVPTAVLEYWGEVLASADRPEWITAALIEHFWPKPRYDGPVPTDSATAATADSTTESSTFANLEPRVRDALTEYAQDLEEWQREVQFKVGKLTPAALVDAFKKADTEFTPGLRLQWEYLQCLRWDVAFYERMVQYKHGINPHYRERQRKSKGTSSRSTSDRMHQESEHTDGQSTPKQNVSSPPVGGKPSTKHGGYIPPHERLARR